MIHKRKIVINSWSNPCLLQKAILIRTHCGKNFSASFTNDLLDFVHVLRSILIGHIGRGDMQFEVRSKIFKIIIIWKFVGDLNIQSNRCFVGPTPSHISNSISSASKKHQWKIIFLHKFDTFGVAFDSDIKAT